ncbi:ABC transporter ATP-binding protein [Chloroflexota bacterium]
MAKDDVLIEVKNLYKYFPIKDGVLQRKVADLKAVDGISFHIKRGETLGLVGETGCGKTTTGRCILRLLKITGGKVFFEGKDLGKLSGRKMRSMRRHIQMIFEDPSKSLDPSMCVEDIIAEPMKIHNLVKGKEYKEQVAELLRMVELEPYMAMRKPHEFSTGQRQRIEIARVLSLRPSFIVCDNPVSALDVSIQAQVVTMLIKLRQEFNLTYLFIAHDLAVVRNISDRVLVMYVGKIMETAGTDELFDNALHPYTQALLSAVLTPDPAAERKRKVIILPGEMPSSINPPSGCRFHPRCNRVIDICKEQEPELENIGNDHWVACHRV